MNPRSLLAALLLLTAAACSSASQFDAKAVAAEWASFMQRDYVVRAGDRLGIRVDDPQGANTGEATDNLQEVVVSPTGTIDLRRVPTPLSVAGKTISAIRSLVLSAHSNVKIVSGVSVTLLEASAQSVYVCGEVSRPGPVAFTPGLTMTQAIASAGSFEITVKHSDIRILRINADGTQRTFRVNMARVLLDEWPDFLLLPGDVVYAQTSSIAEVGNWIDLHIRRMLPFSIGGPALGTIE